MVTSEPTPGRDESRNERADRNWDELMQELRVTQTGTQVLTAFLLTLPFQPRFAEITDLQRTLFLVLVSLAVLSTVLMVAPVVAHRRLFASGRKPELVAVASRLAGCGLAALALVMIGTVVFVVDLVIGGVGTIVAGVSAAAVIGSVWLLLPWRIGRGSR